MDRNFRVGDDYSVVDVVGEGAYGQCSSFGQKRSGSQWRVSGVVCSAVHLPSNQRVAIKKITPFDHSSQSLVPLVVLPCFGLMAYSCRQCSACEHFVKCQCSITLAHELSTDRHLQQTPALLQPRKHHLYPRPPQTRYIRKLQGGLSHSGAHGDGC